MAKITTPPKIVSPTEVFTAYSQDYVGQHSYSQIKAMQDNAQPLNVPNKTRNRDWITFIDIDHKRDGSPQKTYDYITIPTIPYELEYSSESSLQSLASFGRNNPFYQYTGSEDTLSFTLDFYSKVDAKDDVIYWCRWLEAMAKADGYKGGLHRILLQWGKDDRLFAKDTWFISKANYKLSQFQVHRSMLPAQAFMDITLVRVVDHNRTTQEIFGGFRNLIIPTLQSKTEINPIKSIGNGL